MSGPRMKPLFLDTSGMSVEEMEHWGNELATLQKSLNWYLGDLARGAHAKLGENYSQVFPADTSPGAIQRWEAVAKAYPREQDRNPLASWSQHMQNANKPDRIQRVQAHVDAGRTSDEARKADQEARARGVGPQSWLLAFDIHYFAHRHFYSGAGVETAVQVADWVKRTVERLKAKGATDVLCAFEGHGSFRKQLTEGDEWAEQRYKARPPKPEDLTHQLQLVRELLEGYGFCCCSVDGYEADDVMASAAKQFPGKTTIVTADKDLRQCLSDSTNILLDVAWTQDDTSGEMMPEYKWLTAAQHSDAKGITPKQWSAFQCLMGDATDGIRGAEGIGEKGAADLIKEFGTVEAVIEAAKSGDPRIKEKKRQALVEFEGRLEVTKQLVTLVDTLPIPEATRV